MWLSGWLFRAVLIAVTVVRAVQGMFVVHRCIMGCGLAAANDEERPMTVCQQAAP